ncbi:MAG: MBL fold metallo-hydrolase [Deltaproteobacteria bacterium]|nr:MBL fold metallo-hydrolase [Deltaproteobacteria bacterium]
MPTPETATPAPSVTWLGHATATVELGGRRLLFDPLGRARARSAGPLDAVVITHAHVADLGFARVTEAEPGDHIDLGGVDLVAVPTRHDGGRWRKSDTTMCNGYVAMAEGHAVHHAGDVDFSEHAVFDAIGKDFQLDASLLPIGGMLPVWYYRWRKGAHDRGVHIDPDCALDIFERLGARTLVPVHWGTVNLRLGPPSMARRRLLAIANQRGADHRVRVLDHGERLPLDRHDRDSTAPSTPIAPIVSPTIEPKI